MQIYKNIKVEDNDEFSWNVNDKKKKLKKFKIKELESSAMFGLKDVVKTGTYDYTCTAGSTIVEVYKISKFNIIDVFKITPKSLEYIDDEFKKKIKREKKHLRKFEKFVKKNKNCLIGFKKNKHFKPNLKNSEMGEKLKRRLKSPSENFKIKRKKFLELKKKRNPGLAMRKIRNTNIDDIKFIRTINNPTSQKIAEGVMNMKIRQNNARKAYDIFNGDKYAKDKLGASNFLKFKNHKLINMLLKEKNKTNLEHQLQNENSENQKKYKEIQNKILKTDPLRNLVEKLKSEKENCMRNSARICRGIKLKSRERNNMKKHKSCLITRYDDSTKPGTALPFNSPRHLKMTMTSDFNKNAAYLKRKRKFSLNTRKTPSRKNRDYSKVNHTKTEIYFRKKSKEKPFMRTVENFRERPFLVTERNVKSKRIKRRKGEKKRNECVDKSRVVRAKNGGFKISHFEFRKKDSFF